jgi:hypothetical protein
LKLGEEKQERKNQKDLLIQTSIDIASQAQQGVLLAIRLPNNTRIQQHFQPDMVGQRIYDFIQGQECMFDENDLPIPFRLTFGMGETVNPEIPLSEQSLDHPSLISVIVE